MTDLEFLPYHNRHCRFTFQPNHEVTGVIFQWHFSPEDDLQYYYIPTNKLIAYKEAERIGDILTCKKIATAIDLLNIRSAEHLNY